MALIGIHDLNGFSILPPGGWCVDAVLVDSEPVPYPPGNWLIRLNWGWSPKGTLPHPADYSRFASLCARFASRCSAPHYIIGNEPNHQVERPEGEPILAWNYADAFNQCYQAIKAEKPAAQVIVAAVAPWNVQTGFWLDYYATMLKAIPLADGLALHTYSRGAGPVAVETYMDPPYDHYYNAFLSYRDFLAQVPPHHRSLPVYITETNQNQPWVDDPQWVREALQEVESWNRSGGQAIYCLALYRWENYDEYSLAGCPRIIQAIRESHNVYIPSIPNAPIASTALDPALVARGVRLEEVPSGWKLVRSRWLDTHEAQGFGPDHHILVDALNENGNRVTGVSFIVQWPSGSTRITTKGNSGYPWAADYPMSPSFNEFSIVAADALPSDRVSGIGMGKDGNPGEHTSTLLVFQRVVGEANSLPPGPVAPKDIWSRCISFVLDQEGGYANNPLDPGGETKYGISKRSYPHLDIPNLTLDQAVDIYYRDYWVPSGASSQPWPLCLAVFDLAVNGGVGRAKEGLAASDEDFLRLMAWRLDWYTRLSTFRVFGPAWVRRCADLLREGAS